MGSADEGIGNRGADAGIVRVSVVATPRWPVEAFFLLPTRAWELGLGVSIAVMPFVVTPSRVLREALGLLGFVAIVVSICRFDETMRFPGYVASLPAGGTALLIFARGNVVNRRLLGAQPVVAIGLLSYPWYLWHWPLMALARICSAQPPTVGVMLAVAAARPRRRTYRPDHREGTIGALSGGVQRRCVRSRRLQLGQDRHAGRAVG